jgi:redox-sensitive bicupin YhaK (pirin superfamily)
MIEPGYQELLDKDIPRAEKDGVHVKVIAGKALGTESKVRTRSPTMYLDFTIKPNTTFEQEIPDSWNALVYTLKGHALFGATGTKGPAHHTLLLEKTNGTLKVQTENEECRFVLIAGEPTNEPTAQRGPFVMNTQEELMQAMRDFQSNSNGFERAKKWESEEVRKNRGSGGRYR